MAVEPLSPSDLSAIQAERGPVLMHVGGICVFDSQITREATPPRQGWSAPWRFSARPPRADG